MPSNVALILFSVFVLYLLRFERKQTSGVSQALWIPTLWMLYCGSRPLATWESNYLLTSGNGSDASEGSAIDRNFLMCLILLGLATLARRKFDWMAVLKNNSWLFALLLYVLVSVLWSEAPFSSIKSVGKLAGNLVMAMVVLSEESPKQALESIFRRVAYILIPYSLLLIKYFPNLGVFYLPYTGDRWWIGVTTTKNSLGVLCIISVLFLVWSLLLTWKQRKASGNLRWSYLDLLVLCISLFLLKGEVSYSATSVVCLATGIITVLGLHWIRARWINLRLWMLLVPVALIIIFGASIPFLGTAATSGVTSFLGRDVTFTGRTGIWAQLVPMALEEPLLGHGYGGFWLGHYYAEVNEAHNGYLEVVLGLGFVGLIFVIGFIASCCREAYIGILKNSEMAFFAFALIIMIVLHNITEASFVEETELMWVSLVFAKLVIRSEIIAKAEDSVSSVNLHFELATPSLVKD
jgi:exopolysaccharide production protein ExoQ